MNALINDIRYAIRQLHKSPNFTAVAVISLTLGIGANTAIFSLLNSVLLRSLPVRNPHELRGINWVGNFTPNIWGRVVGAPNGEQTSNTFTYPAYCELRDHGRGVAGVFAFFELGPFNSSTAIIRGRASCVNALLVSGNFFRGLGLEPTLGRVLTPEDDHPDVEPVAVVSYRAWKKYFGGGPNVIGQEIVLDQVCATVIGVLPKGFLGIEKGRQSDFYLPLSLQPQIKGVCALESTDLWWVQVMARLKPSADELEVSRSLEASLTQTTGESDFPDLRIILTDGSGGLGGALAPRIGLMAKPLYLLFGLVGILLLVTCINLAGLLLARGITRCHEFAIRAALGAGRKRLIRQLLTESAVLAAMGGGCGFVFALWVKPVLVRMVWTPDTALNVQGDIHVYGFMLMIVVATTVLLGLLPALRMARANPIANLKHRTMLGGPRLALNKMLISLQVGLSLLLLVGAGLLTRTLINIRRIESGLDVEKLLVFRADVGQRQADFCSAVGALPGVQAVSYANLPLLTGARSNTSVPLPDDPSERLPILTFCVGASFLEATGIPLLAGRAFGTLDTGESQRVIVINRALAQAAFPDDNPVGRFLMIGQQEYRIVGICGDSKYYDLKMPFEPAAFFPSRQGTFYAIRAAASPQDLIQMVRQTLDSVDASIPMSGVTTLEDRISENTRKERCFAWLVSSLALLAVLQSCIGLYGLMAHHVIHRTSEIGLRKALGASPRAVAWPILRSALSMAAVGVVIGVPVVWGVVRIIRSHLYGIQPHDPVTIVAATALLIGIVTLTAWIPARRAARIDPMEALRYE